MDKKIKSELLYVPEYLKSATIEKLNVLYILFYVFFFFFFYRSGSPELKILKLFVTAHEFPANNCTFFSVPLYYMAVFQERLGNIVQKAFGLHLWCFCFCCHFLFHLLCMEKSSLNILVNILFFVLWKKRKVTSRSVRNTFLDELVHL